MKAQFEAMGLAIVVVLVSLGMFFLLFFSTTKGADFSYRYDREQAAQNFVDSFLKTPLEGCPHTMRDLLEDTIVLHRDVCDLPGSKTQFEQTASLLLNLTFRDRDIPYDFEVDSVTYTFKDATCDHNLEDTDKFGKQPLVLPPSYVGVNVTLWICVR